MTEKDKERVWNILECKLGLHNMDVKFDDNSLLRDDMYADSLDAVEIVMEMEKVFKVVIPDEDVESIKTVKDIYRVIDKLRNHEAQN